LAQLDNMVLDLKAVGEVTRLRLLALLSLGELSVKDITHILNQSQPRISRHLKLLVEGGFVKRHAQGAWAYFSINYKSEKAQFIYSLLDKLDLYDEQLQKDRQAMKLLQQEQRQQSAKYFSEVAKKWDLIRSLHVEEKLVEAEILSVVGTKKRDLMMDLGTGTASMLLLLKNIYKHGVGIDSSKEMIEIARSKLAENEISHANIRLGDIEKLEEYENLADLVIMHQILHYFDDPSLIIAFVRQVLKTNGEILIVDFAPHEFEFLAVEHAHRRLGLSQEQMQIWANKAGLRVALFKEIPNIDDSKGLSVCLWLLKNKNLSY